MKELHITVANGDDEVTHKVPLGPASTVTVRSLVDDGSGRQVDDIKSFGEIVDVETVDVEDAKLPEPNIVQESPHLSSPQTVLQFAQSGPVADADALVAQAEQRYPDDAQVAQAREVVEQRLAGTQTAGAVDTGTISEATQTDATAADADQGAHDAAVTAAQQTIAAAADPTVETPTIDHLEQAISDVDAALAVYPDSAELADAKTQLEQLHADAAQGQGS